LGLAYDALDIGGSMTAVMNSANEKLVELFLDNKMRFLDIPKYIEKTMEYHLKSNFLSNPNLEDILSLDKWTRQHVGKIVL